MLPLDLDDWLPRPQVRTRHRRAASAAPGALWDAASHVRLDEAGTLGRVVRWRIPGLPPQRTFRAMFAQEPFTVLAEGERWSVSGLVGRIWTLRRDYPKLHDSNEYGSWDVSGTAKVLFGHWIEPVTADRVALCSEVRVRAIGAQGRLGVAAVRPLVSTFQHLVGSEGIAAAVRQAEQG